MANIESSTTNEDEVLLTTNDNSTNDPVMLTTVDNPYSPFQEFKEWYAYDLIKGYNTLSLLARVAVTSSELSDLDREQSIDYAIDSIINEGMTGIHKKVTKKDYNVEN